MEQPARSFSTWLAIVSAMLLFFHLHLFQFVASVLFVAVATGLYGKKRWAKPLGVGIALYSIGLAATELLFPLSGLRFLPFLWGASSVWFLIALARESRQAATPSA